MLKVAESRKAGRKPNPALPPLTPPVPACAVFSRCSRPSFMRGFMELLLQRPSSLHWAPRPCRYHFSKALPRSRRNDPLRRKFGQVHLVLSAILHVLVEPAQHLEDELLVGFHRGIPMRLVG